MGYKVSGMTIFTLFFVVLVDAFGWGVAFPVLAPVLLQNSTHMLAATVSISARNELYGLMMGIYCLGMFFASPWLGSMADRFGRKRVLVIAMAGICVGFLISAVGITASSLLLLLVGRAVAGLTGGSLPIAQAALIDISEEEKRAARIGLAVLGNVLGFAIGPVVGGIFMDKHLFAHVSYQLPFLVSSGVGLLGLLMVLIFFKETYQGDVKVKVNVFACTSYIKEAFTNPRLRILCLTIAFFMLAWGMYFSSMPTLMTERFHWSGSSIAYFITFIAIIFAVLVLFVIQPILRKFSYVKVISVSLLVLAISAALFAFNPFSHLNWILLALAGVVPLAYVAIINLLSEQVDATQQGRLMGIVGSVFALMWGIGPIIGGYLFDYSLITPFLFVAVSLLVGLMIFRRFKPLAK